MKGLILEKRGKRIIALCLVILQVLFQFPVEGKTQVEKNKQNEIQKEISIFVKGLNGKSLGNKEARVQVKITVYDYKGILSKNYAESEIISSKSTIEKDDTENKTSNSSLRDEKASDNKVMPKRGKNYTVSRESFGIEEGFGDIEEDEEVGKAPIDPIVEYYEGIVGADGQVIQKISEEYFQEGVTFIISIRVIAGEYVGKQEVRYQDGERKDGEQRTNIVLSLDKKTVWPGKLEIDKIPEQVFQDEKALRYSVNATYNDGAKPPREIEYYLEDSKKQRKRIENPQNFLIHEPGIYKVFAIIPGDENYSDLIAEADLPARKAYTGKYFLEERQEVPLDEGNKINFKINPDINAKATLEVVKNKNIVNIINNEIWMKNVKGEINIRATVPDWEKDGIPYQGFTDELIVYITPGHQSGFQFAPSEFIKRVAEDNDVSIYEYRIPYGLTEIDESGKHSLSLKTIGQKSTGKVVYELEDGGQIADLDKEHGILKFKDGQIGTVIVSATAPASEDRSYESKKIVAKVGVNYENSITVKQGERPSAKGWYKSITYLAPEKYSISLSNSWKDSDEWKNKLTFEEGASLIPGQKIFLKRNENGQISIGGELENFQIDGTPPQLSSIVDSKNKETKIKSIRDYDFYKDPLEIELKAEDAKSQVSAIHYRLEEEGKTRGEWIEMKEGTPGFEKINNSNKVIVKFPLNPQFRGRIRYYAVDNADNKSNEQVTDRVLVLDTIKPKGSFDFQSEGKKVNDHFYFQDKAFLTLNVEEKNFFPEDQDFSLKVYSRRNGEDKESSYRVQGNRESLTLKKNSTFISDERELVKGQFYFLRANNT